MKITSHKKRGFTLVELIVVIAIVAILAAVSVVSYMAFIKQANISSDTQLVQQLNTVLQGDEAVHGPRENLTETLKVVEQNGFIVERLTPTTANYDIVYDRVTNRFALLDENENPVYQDSVKKYNKSTEVWRILTSRDNSLSNEYSNYLGESFDVSALVAATEANTIRTGFDCGRHIEPINLVYNSANSDVESAIIRTQGGKLEVNDAYDTVTHYEFASEVEVKAVAPGTYYEYGTVGRMYYKASAGKYYIGAGATVYCFMNQTTEAEFDASESTVSNKATIYTKLNSDLSIESELEDVTASDVDTVNRTVKIPTCTHHNEDYEIVTIGTYKYIVCMCCGAFSLYDLSDSNPNKTEPVSQSEGVENNGFDVPSSELGIETYGFHKSYPANDGHWIHEVSNKAEFKNIATSADCTIENENHELIYPGYEDSNTEFIVISDINFGQGEIWTNRDNIGDYIFTGTLKGQKNNTNVPATLSGYHTSTILANHLSNDMGLFDLAIDFTFENLIIDDFVLDNGLGKGVGLLVAGWTNGISTEKLVNDVKYEMNFINVVTNANCSINASQNVGGFAGYSRNVAKFYVDGCTNNAKITVSGSTAAGFVGSGSTYKLYSAKGAKHYLFKDSINNGRITAPGSHCAGFAAFIYESNNTNHLNVSINNCQSNGDIVCTSTTDCGFFLGESTGLSEGTFDQFNGDDAFGLETHIPFDNANNSASAIIYNNEKDCGSPVEKYSETLRLLYGSKTEFTDHKKASSFKKISIKNGTADLNKNYTEVGVITISNLPSVFNRVDLTITACSQYCDTSTMTCYDALTGDTVIYSDYIDGEKTNWTQSIYRVNRLGYFKKGQGYANPSCEQYDYGYKRFQLDYQTYYTNPAYEDGFHNNAEGSYFVMDQASRERVFHCFRNWITYKVCAYDENGDLIGYGCELDMYATDNSYLNKATEAYSVPSQVHEGDIW